MDREVGRVCGIGGYSHYHYRIQCGVDELGLWGQQGGGRLEPGARDGRGLSVGWGLD